ncbi:hypothetical protein E6C76_03860 [Pseudothauera nasutitermitis]|uniref:Uncharacterized protein n=1 Tax=Pseudothauera nasutitermitis TaxID=2565930 RepID=A0A4S4B6P3_9RHOO|nr:hypothetical protein [Pseudothauera nasutitermitis]THF67506.1 hypothetical protein E6C76_03860 [Pseudothauera nasutitermitis]
MDDWKVWALWAAVGFNLAAGAWSLAAAIRYTRKEARLDRETLGTRPLLSDDRVASLRPGDTVLMLLPLAGMTADQQTALIGSIKTMAESAKARGIEFIVLPDWGKKAIVVSRGIQAERADDEAARKEDAEWLFQVWKEVGERDQAALAELESSAEAVRKESAAAVLREARLQLAAELEPLLRAIQKKAQSLQGLQSGPAGAPGLLEDVRALSEAISKIP